MVRWYIAVLTVIIGQSANAQIEVGAGFSGGLMRYTTEEDTEPSKKGPLTKAHLFAAWLNDASQIRLLLGGVSGVLKGETTEIRERTDFKAVTLGVSYLWDIYNTGVFFGPMLDSISGNGTSPSYKKRDEFSTEVMLGAHLGKRFDISSHAFEIFAEFGITGLKDENVQQWHTGFVYLFPVRSSVTAEATKSTPPVIAEEKSAASSISFIAVTFGYASVVLDTAAKAKIKLICDALKAHSLNWQTIDVSGYAAAGGKFNERHAIERANSVKTAMVANGLDPTRIRVVGHGSNRLLRDKAPDEKDQRRAEITIQRVKDLETLRNLLPQDLGIVIN